MSLRSKSIIISILVAFFLVIFSGCTQHIKTEAIHYPEYWKTMGYGNSKNITMKIIPVEDDNDARTSVNGIVSVALADYIQKQQKTLKIVDANQSSHLRLLIATSDYIMKTDSQQMYNDEIVYKTDQYGFPIYDSDGNKIPVWKTDQYGRHLYTDEGKPLLKTKRTYYTVKYNEAGCTATAVLVDERSKEIIDTYQTTRSYWSRGVNAESEGDLFAKALAKIVEDIYSKYSPYTFVLNVTDSNIFRTAKYDMDNEGNYDWTKKFQADEETARIILKLPSTANDNEFEIVICEKGASINAQDSRLVSIPIVWNGQDDQVSYDFSPAELYSRTGGKTNYEAHLVQNNKSLLHENITIKPNEE